MMSDTIPDVTLQNYLERNGIVENNSALEKRRKAVDIIKSLVPELTHRIAIEKGRKIHNAKCQIKPFGSYGLGAYIAGADIDLIFLAPHTILRNDFFRHFPAILRQHPNVYVEEVVTRTNVPIIKCTIFSLSIDISFASLSLERVPKEIDLLNNRLLQNIDSVCLASMDGPRTQQFIIRNVSHHHAKTFCLSLCYIKYWATRRYLYGKAMGYLNGSTWTFLLLKTYIRDFSKTAPKQVSVYELLQSFFKMWSTWDWPNPVLLTEFIPDINGASVDIDTLGDFDNRVMPIVSPCYPVCSSAPFVTRSTLNVMTKELQRAYTILSKTELGPDKMMDKLFRPFNFLKTYQHFLLIKTTCESSKDCGTWTRKVASAMPKFVRLLEDVPEIAWIHPATKPYTSVCDYSTRMEKLSIQMGNIFQREAIQDFSSPLEPGALHVICYVIALKVELPKGETVLDLSTETSKFLEELESRKLRRDRDVTFSITAGRRQDVGGIFGQ